MNNRNSIFYIAVILVIIVAVIFLVARQKEGPEQQDTMQAEKVFLWNQQDFEDWEFYLKDTAADPYGVFTINEGKIDIKGTPFGYMRTKKKFSDYTLHLEWRWPGEPGNSGVFLHMQQPDTIWPPLIECQLQAGNAGDMIFAGGTKAEELGDSTWVLRKSEQSTEKDPGEWNVYEITARNDSIIAYVNGTLQNVATHLSVSEGCIGLQSEGAPIEFRNIYIMHKP